MKKQKKVLVYIEFDAIRSIIVNALKKKDYEVVEASIDQPLDDILNGVGYNLVISDSENKENTGTSLVESMRDLSMYTYTPVMMLTGFKKDKIVSNNQHLNVACFLQKPFDIVEFYSIVERLV